MTRSTGQEVAAPHGLRLRVMAVLAILIVLASIEGGARLGERASPPPVPPVEDNVLVNDPVFHHRWPPNHSFISSTRSVPYRVYSNSQRWVEDHEVPLAKAPGTYRVFYVGDSTTEGVVMPENKMVRIVERKLGEILKRRVESVNTGTSSWSIFQYYLLSRYVLPNFSPDLVVFDVDMTDVANDFFYRTFARFDAQGDPVAVDPSVAGGGVHSGYRLTPFGTVAITPLEALSIRLHRRSATFRWMERGKARVWPPPEVTGVQQPRGILEDEDANWLAKPWSPKTRRNVAYSMNLLGKAIDLLHARGVKVMVTSVPHYRQFTGDWSVEPHRAVEETATRHGAPYLDTFQALRPAMEGAPQTAFFWANDDTHFNVEGNALWAEAQLSFLLAHRAELGLSE